MEKILDRISEEELRKKQIVNAFIKPELYKNLDGIMDLKDYFINEIKNRLEKNGPEAA